MRLIAIGLTVLLLPLCALLTALMPALGAQTASKTASEQRAPMFESCQLPCWAGLTPGETPYDEVIPRLTAALSGLNTPVQTGGALVSFGWNSGGQQSSGAIYYQQGKVGDIHLNTVMSMSDLLEALGTPTCVWFNRVPFGELTGLIVHWDIGNLSIRTLLIADKEGKWQPGTPAQDLIISVNGQVCTQTKAPAWLGFAPAWRYEAELLRAD